jgi:hypothetical protein
MVERKIEDTIEIKIEVSDHNNHACSDKCRYMDLVDQSCCLFGKRFKYKIVSIDNAGEEGFCRLEQCLELEIASNEKCVKK